MVVELKENGISGLRNQRRICYGIACGIGGDSLFNSIDFTEAYNYAFSNKTPYKYDKDGNILQSIYLRENKCKDNLNQNELLC